MNKTAKTAARKTVNVLMLVILAFLTTLPIFWCIITSLKTPQDISAYPPKIFNFTVTWNNYKQVFAQSFLQTAGNSVVYSLLTILACLILGYLAAYGFERRRFPLKKLLGNSFIMAVGNLPVTLTLALLWALAGVGCFYMSGVFFVWVGLAIFVSSYFINTVFKKYTGELAEEQAAWEQADRERKQRKKMQKRGLL